MYHGCVAYRDRERRLSTLYILENTGRQTEHLIHVSFLPFISVQRWKFHQNKIV